MKKMLAKIDDWQQRRPAAAFLVGVVKKYGDNRGGYLAALIAYYGFLSLFPLLLLFYTVSAYILPHYPGAQKALTASIVGEFPVIGTQLRSNTGKPLQGSPIALIFGVLGLAWGALGVSQVLQDTMYEVWDVPRSLRPGFGSRVLRGVLLFGLLGAGVIATTVVTSLGSILAWGPFGSVLAAIPAAVVNIGVFLCMFRLLSPPHVDGRALLPGAIVAGTGWQILQTIGVNLVSHQLRHASQVYGVFGFTLALLSFLYLGAQLTVYAAEINVVRLRHAWPRSLLPETPDGSESEAGFEAAESGATDPERLPRAPAPA